MKRKIYDKMLEWKNSSDGATALMLDGARREGGGQHSVFASVYDATAGY